MSNEELVAAIQAGATERMGELWGQVEGLVKRKAKHIMTALDLRGNPCGVEFDDLYQSGYIAMVDAVHYYNPGSGIAFSTCLINRLKTVFAEATGYRTQKSLHEPLNNYLSLDTPLTDDADSGVLMDVVADPAGLQWQESIEEAMWRKELQEAVWSVLQTVQEEYREILHLRYWEDMTLQEISELQGISRNRIAQMEHKALRQLKQPQNACKLYSFFDFDFYSGTGLGAFRYGGMSVQERYLIVEEERLERQDRRHREERKQQIDNAAKAEVEEISQRARAKVAKMTTEEKAELLKRYGL